MNPVTVSAIGYSEALQYKEMMKWFTYKNVKKYTLGEVNKLVIGKTRKLRREIELYHLRFQEMRIYGKQILFQSSEGGKSSISYSQFFWQR